MHRIRNIRSLACVLAGLAGALLLAFSAAAPAAFAYRLPPAGGPQTAPPAIPRLPPLPPGWNKHPPLPAHAPTITAGGMPGWQVTLIATAVLLAAVLAVTGYRILAARRRASTSAALSQAASLGHPATSPARGRTTRTASQLTTAGSSNTQPDGRHPQ